MIWKKESVRLLKATEEVKKSNKLQAASVDCDKVRQKEKSIYSPRKTEPQLKSVIVYYSDFFDRDTAIPYALAYNCV